MELVNFNQGTELVNKFLGSEKKKTILLDGKIYLLKFPDPIREKGRDISYINNVISEYLGCKIYESVGIDTQKVVLGTYTEKREKLVCGCEDFVKDGMHLYEYKNFLLADVEAKTPNDFELNEILESIEENPMLHNKTEIKNRFWDMFVMDAFIGNPDRHIGNWGLIGTGKSGELMLAPIYDCGSCLFPLMGREEIMMLPESEYGNKAYNVYSCYRENGKRIHAGRYLLDGKNPDCNRAVKRNVPKIDMSKIKAIIEDIPALSMEEKYFYETILDIRYEKILSMSLKKLQKQEKKQEQKKQYFPKL